MRKCVESSVPIWFFSFVCVPYAGGGSLPRDWHNRKFHALRYIIDGIFQYWGGYYPETEKCVSCLSLLMSLSLSLPLSLSHLSALCRGVRSMKFIHPPSWAAEKQTSRFFLEPVEDAISTVAWGISRTKVRDSQHAARTSTGKFQNPGEDHGGGQPQVGNIISWNIILVKTLC